MSSPAHAEGGGRAADRHAEPAERGADHGGEADAEAAHALDAGELVRSVIRAGSAPTAGRNTASTVPKTSGEQRRAATVRGR